MVESVVLLPDLRGETTGGPSEAGAGWFVQASSGVAVPSLFEARECAKIAPPADADPCQLRLRFVDLEQGGIITAFGEGPFPDSELTPGGQLPPPGTARVIAVRAVVTPGLAPGAQPLLTVRSVAVPANEVQVAPASVGACSSRLAFVVEFPLEFADGDYDVFVTGYEATVVRITLATVGTVVDIQADPCALQLTPKSRKVGIAVPEAPATFPRPPLLAVDGAGCVVSVWSTHPGGQTLAPTPGNDAAVGYFATCSGGLIAKLTLGEPIRDALFWGDAIAVLTASAVHLFDLRGCPLGPTVFASGLVEAVALGVDGSGALVVVHRPAVGPSATNIRLFRADGSELAPPQSVAGRGWYAGQRSRAFVFDKGDCQYLLDPSLQGASCCADPPRPLSDEESLFFRLVDDLRDLRKRVAFSAQGEVVIGPATFEDPLDAGRPGTQWHQIHFFGELPEGCTVQVETRAFDDLLAGDPLIATGWSKKVTATPASATPVASPGDTRQAMATVTVLAKPGRFLWVRLTLLSNGCATPQVEAIEAVYPRVGIGRFLPAVFQNSTPEDDFLPRWLSIFENTAFDGVQLRMDDYAELFDPRTAPPEMLPFLAGWLEILDLARLRGDLAQFRRVLASGAELARTRGTIDGLILAVRLYLGIQIQIVESFKLRSGFVLDAGTTLMGTTGPLLGVQTILTAERCPTWLGDEPLLGCSYLLDCEERVGNIPYQFEVIVNARDICSSEDLALLNLVIQTEKPAHTSYKVKPVGEAGFVVGVQSIVGQALAPDFDRNELDPATYGLAVLNGPLRPKPLGLGFTLGRDSRLSAPSGNPKFRLAATVGRTTRVGA